MLLEDSKIKLLPDFAVLVGRDLSHLVVADLHLGKSAAFRANGLAIPEGDSSRDLSRLLKLVQTHQPTHLVVAGDLFHSASGQSAELVTAFLKFLEAAETAFTLVMGNHDQKIHHLPAELNQTPHLDIGKFRIIHNPSDASPDHFNICGHIHPVIKIPDGKNTALRLPCFHLQKNILTLPSFGSFTGGQVVKPKKHDRFFVTHMEKVIELPENLL